MPFIPQWKSFPSTATRVMSSADETCPSCGLPDDFMVEISDTRQCRACAAASHPGDAATGDWAVLPGGPVRTSRLVAMMRLRGQLESVLCDLDAEEKKPSDVKLFPDEVSKRIRCTVADLVAAFDHERELARREAADLMLGESSPLPWSEVAMLPLKALPLSECLRHMVLERLLMHVGHVRNENTAPELLSEVIATKNEQGVREIFEFEIMQYRVDGAVMISFMGSCRLPRSAVAKLDGHEMIVLDPSGHTVLRFTGLTSEALGWINHSPSILLSDTGEKEVHVTRLDVMGSSMA